MGNGMSGFYVYLWICPVKLYVFYVGKAKGHRGYDFYGNRGRNVLCKVKSLKTAGFVPIVEIVKDNLSSEAAYNLEKELISFYGRKDLGKGLLRNGTDGGDGATGRKGFKRGPVSKETKRKLSLANKGKVISKEVRRKMSEGRMGDKHHKCWRGKKMPKEHVEKRRQTMLLRYKGGMKNGMFGKKHSLETRKLKSESAKRSWIRRKALITFNQIMSERGVM